MQFKKYKKTFDKNSSFSIILNKNLSKYFINSTFNVNYETYENSIGFGVNVFNDKILLNGLSFLDDSIKISNNIFKESSSSELKNYEIVPKKSTSIKSYNFKKTNNNNVRFFIIFQIKKTTIETIEYEIIFQIIF